MLRWPLMPVGLLLKNLSIFIIWLKWRCPSTRTRPRGHEIHNFNRPFLAHYYFTLTVVCLILYGHVLAQEPLPRGHEIYNLGRPFLDHHYYTLILSETCHWVEKKFFLEIHQFYTSYPKITFPLGGGSWNLQFLVCLPYRSYIPNLVKIGTLICKMFTHNGQ